MAKYTPMMEQYLSIKADYPDAFLFFRLGDFYELFFDDAILASRELEITLTGRDGGSDERIPMCGVPYHSVDSYLQQLLKKGYKAAICEQVEDPKEAKGVVRREVVRVLTPGTIMEGKMLSDRENNYLVTAWIKDSCYALAACDISTGHFHAAGFHNMDQLVGEILSYHPKEILIHNDEYSMDLKTRCSTQGVQTIQVIPADPFASFTLLAEQQFATPIQDPLVKETVGLLISYIQDTQKKNLSHIQELDIYQAEEYMIIDPYSKRNLELMETLLEKSKKGSLLWYLDHTVTAMGARMLRKWVDKPLFNQVEIEKRLDSVHFFAHDFMIREEVRELLKSVYDLERLAGRISFGNANARDLVNLRSSLEVVPKIKQLFQSRTDLLPLGMIHLVDRMDDCQDIALFIDQAIVEDPPISLKEGGIIKEGYDEYLDRLKVVSRNGKKWIANLEQQEREATGIRSLKIGYNRVFGYYIEVTRANLATVPEGRYERKQTLANAERFITPELKEQEALILEADEKLTELEYQIFTDIRLKVAAYVSRLQGLAGAIAYLDALTSLAEVAQANRLVRPTFTTSSSLIIIEGRHPVVEKVLEDAPFIPNDTTIDMKDQRVLLITGPNMAGKSTYMRQLALMVIMAQMGSFVPAKEACLSLVDRIFTRIGAADDLVGGQSTFMVEMKDIYSMTTQATKDSLVIIDEIGRGTSTHDGMAIAQAVIEYLHDQIGCRSLVSTHYHELAVLEDGLAGLKNYHMAVQEKEDNVIFLRKLKRGATDESYGIYCAKLAGLPFPIIDRAHELLTVYKSVNQPKECIPVQEMLQEESTKEIQLDLFTSDQKGTTKEPGEEIGSKKNQKWLKEIKEVDLINMTPLQALNFLYEIKQKLK